MASTSAVRLENDRTAAFRDLISSAGPSAVENQRRWERQRDESLGPVLSSGFVLECRKRQKLAKDGPGLSHKEKDCLQLRHADEEWIREAARVHRTIGSISDFLQTIRKPYVAGSGSGSAGRKAVADKQQGEGQAFSAWHGVTSLTDRERDEIEFQVKMTIKRCLACIKELEKGENVRRRTSPHSSANPLSRLLGSVSGSQLFVGRAHPLYSEQLSQHRSAITQFLSAKLAKANARMGDMQEARVKAQRAKQINLAGSAAGTTRTGGEPARAAVAGSVSKANGAEKAFKGQLLERPYQAETDGSQLTAEQIQQFDKESSALIESLTDDLRAVEAAEQKLSEISELQTQLIQHLGSQAEMADNLLQEAVGHTLEVGKGNEQLRRAKESNRQASRFLCIFLIGSGLGLLFLHWVD